MKQLKIGHTVTDFQVAEYLRAQGFDEATVMRFIKCSEHISYNDPKFGQWTQDLSNKWLEEHALPLRLHWIRDPHDDSEKAVDWTIVAI